MSSSHSFSLTELCPATRGNTSTTHPRSSVWTVFFFRLCSLSLSPPWWTHLYSHGYRVSDNRVAYIHPPSLWPHSSLTHTLRSFGFLRYPTPAYGLVSASVWPYECSVFDSRVAYTPPPPPCPRSSLTHVKFFWIYSLLELTTLSFWVAIKTTNYPIHLVCERLQSPQALALCLS